MTLALETLVDPEAYDKLLYKTLHSVVDRTIELASLADTAHPSRDDDEDNPDNESIEDIIRSQANFTPSEQSELQFTGPLLNLLINAAVARRAGLYNNNHDNTEEPTNND